MSWTTISQFTFPPWAPLLLIPSRVRTIFLWTGGLRCAKAGQLLRGFGVDNGGVAPLQVLGDAHHVAVAVIQLPLAEEVLKLWSAINALDWKGREMVKEETNRERERGRNKLDSFLPPEKCLTGGYWEHVGGNAMKTATLKHYSRALGRIHLNYWVCLSRHAS